MPRDPKQNTHDNRSKKCYKLVKLLAEQNGVNTHQSPMSDFDDFLILLETTVHEQRVVIAEVEPAQK